MFSFVLSYQRSSTPEESGEAILKTFDIFPIVKVSTKKSYFLVFTYSKNS